VATLVFVPSVFALFHKGSQSSVYGAHRNI
jgi:hypothetical protein